MKFESNKIVLESKREIEILQDVVEIAIACGDCTDEEKAIAKDISSILENMLYSKNPLN